jgi:hypothetical protein
VLTIENKEYTINMKSHIIVISILIVIFSALPLYNYINHPPVVMGTATIPTTRYRTCPAHKAARIERDRRSKELVAIEMQKRSEIPYKNEIESAKNELQKEQDAVKLFMDKLKAEQKELDKKYIKPLSEQEKYNLKKNR